MDCTYILAFFASASADAAFSSAANLFATAAAAAARAFDFAAALLAVAAAACKQNQSFHAWC